MIFRIGDAVLHRRDHVRDFELAPDDRKGSRLYSSRRKKNRMCRPKEATSDWSRS
jgi:hypothetical protein